MFVNHYFILSCFNRDVVDGELVIIFLVLMKMSILPHRKMMYKQF